MSCYSMSSTFIVYDDNVAFQEKSMILCHYKGTVKGVILGNMLIYVAKWTIWKQ
jgi:hypothetical protein